MSELQSIWNDTQLRAATPPPPFNIPNNPNAKTIKINNQSKYWLIIYKTHTNIDVDRIEPFSYLTVPYQKDISLKVETNTGVSSLIADKMFVDYSTIDGGVVLFSKGSTQFLGSSNVTVNGGVTINNSSLNVAIQGTPTINVGTMPSVSITGTPTFNVGTMPNVTIANAAIKVQIDQLGGNNTIALASGSTVSINGTPTMNIGTMPNVTFAAGSTVAITGTPTMNIGTMPNVTIANAAIKVQIDQVGGNNTIALASGSTVAISGTPTFNVGTMPNVTIANAAIKVQIDQLGGNNTIALASGSTVSISGTPTFNVGTMPAVTFAAGSSVQITGTPTMNIGTMPNVSIANATLNVKLDQTAGNNSVVISGTPSVSISGTPTINVGTMPNVTIANAAIKVQIDQLGGNNTIALASGSTVSISGTPTMNIGTMPNVSIANATLNVKLDQTAGNNSVVISGTPTVSISGTPTFNVGTMPNVTIAGTPTFNLSAGTSVNIGNTPSVNVSNSLTIASGNITVGSATISNQQLTTAQIYNSSTTYTVPISTTSINLTYQFLPVGTMANVHHVDIYLKSSKGYSYTLTTATGKVFFADGSQFNPISHWTVTNGQAGSWFIDGQAVICNNINFTLTCASTAAADTITVYFAIDTNESAIGSIQGTPIKGWSDYIKTANGTCTNANQSYQVLAGGTNRQYLFFQNLSNDYMYISLGGSMPPIGNPGYIILAPNGGSFVQEGSFVSKDTLLVQSAAAGADYTCYYY